MADVNTRYYGRKKLDSSESDSINGIWEELIEDKSVRKEWTYFQPTHGQRGRVQYRKSKGKSYGSKTQSKWKEWLNTMDFKPPKSMWMVARALHSFEFLGASAPTAEESAASRTRESPLRRRAQSAASTQSSDVQSIVRQASPGPSSNSPVRSQVSQNASGSGSDGESSITSLPPKGKTTLRQAPYWDWFRGRAKYHRGTGIVWGVHENGNLVPVRNPESRQQTPRSVLSWAAPLLSAVRQRNARAQQARAAQPPNNPAQAPPRANTFGQVPPANAGQQYGQQARSDTFPQFPDEGAPGGIRSAHPFTMGTGHNARPTSSSSYSHTNTQSYSAASTSRDSYTESDQSYAGARHTNRAPRYEPSETASMYTGSQATYSDGSGSSGVENLVWDRRRLLTYLDHIEEGARAARLKFRCLDVNGACLELIVEGANQIYYHPDLAIDPWLDKRDRNKALDILERADRATGMKHDSTQRMIPYQGVRFAMDPRNRDEQLDRFDSLRTEPGGHRRPGERSWFKGVLASNLFYLSLQPHQCGLMGHQEDVDLANARALDLLRREVEKSEGYLTPRVPDAVIINIASLVLRYQTDVGADTVGRVAGMYSGGRT